ncbi:MAG: AAA family ATPase [bacterium]|nr:AAA family ATPase [bacterium]
MAETMINAPICFREETNMLQSLQVKGYRGIDGLKIDEMQQFNLLIGPNNSGKSSLLEALFLHCTPGNFIALLRIISARHGGFRPNSPYLTWISTGRYRFCLFFKLRSSQHLQQIAAFRPIIYHSPKKPKNSVLPLKSQFLEFLEVTPKSREVMFIGT